MRVKPTGPLHITCPHLGMKQDETTAFAFPSPGNYCYNCKIPTSPSKVHQEKFCLTTARNECSVYNQDKNIAFPQNLIAVSVTSQFSVSKWRKLLWVMLGLIGIIVIYYFVYSYLKTGKNEILPFLLPQSSDVLPSPTKTTIIKSLSVAFVTYTYTLIFIDAPSSTPTRAHTTTQIATQVPPTATKTPTIKPTLTASQKPTLRPIKTNTSTPLPTDTPQPNSTNTPIPPTDTPAPIDTPTDEIIPIETATLEITP